MNHRGAGILVFGSSFLGATFLLEKFLKTPSRKAGEAGWQRARQIAALAPGDHSSTGITNRYCSRSVRIGTQQSLLVGQACIQTVDTHRDSLETPHYQKGAEPLSTRPGFLATNNSSGLGKPSTRAFWEPGREKDFPGGNSADPPKCRRLSLT